MAKLYKIETPNLGNSYDFTEIIKNLNEPEVQAIIKKIQEKYLSWKEFKHKDWATKTPEKVWATLKAWRLIQNQKTQIIDGNGINFQYNPTIHLKFLHQIDLELGGTLMRVDGFSESDKKGFISKNIIEESIASSQLEGANTPREAAKKLLSEGTPPKNKSEQMIVNNHQALQAIESSLKNEPLTIELLKTLHQMVTIKTIDEAHQGTLRETFGKNGDRLVIKPWNDEEIAYQAPDKEFVEHELPKLITFANHDDADNFIHPLIKGILLHFWIGLLHPFEDGNGRLARIIFYWYMLRNGYWGFSYLSLSERILKSPNQYAMAFINTEQDGHDLNYFIHYNISKLKLAQQHFQEYLKRKISENKHIAAIIKDDQQLNQRQLKLLQYLAKDAQRFTTLAQHLAINSEIKTRMTASQDLGKLVKDGLLIKKRNGRNIYYYPTEKIKELFGK